MRRFISPDDEEDEIGYRCIGVPVFDHGGNFRQTSAKLRTSIGHGRSVEVGPRRGRRRGCIGNLVGARGHNTHALQVQTQALGRDLLDLGVQPLSHFGAAMIHLHAAVPIDQHQSAGLIEKRRGEGNAKLHRRNGQPTLAMWITRV